MASRLFLPLALLPASVWAQWLSYPTPGIPRTAGGDADLAAPTPTTPDGHPDLSGIWGATSGYLHDLAKDGAEAAMLPAAAALYRERLDNNGKDRPSTWCLPHSVTDFDAHPQPKKLIQLPGLIVILFESYHSYRQIFTDGRPLPEDPDPAWFGYSVGRWEGDTLVVDTTGIHEKTWLDDSGHPHSAALHVIERFRRRDFGHMDVEITIDDPETYAKPWTVTIPWNYVPDTDLLDWVCENNRDPEFMVGK